MVLVEITSRNTQKIINLDYMTRMEKCGSIGLIYLVYEQTLDDCIEVDLATYEHLVQILNNRCGIFKI